MQTQSQCSLNTSGVSNCQSKDENKREEWPYYKKLDISYKTHAAPLLIMEIHRLQPVQESNLPRLQVLHMPQIQVRNAEIIGIVRKVYNRSKLDLTVDDGTGRIQVLFSWENVKKVKEERKKIDSKFQRLNKIAEIKNSGPDQIKILEERWKQETKNGKLGIDFQVLDYVNVVGFLHLDYGILKNIPKKDINVEKGNLCKPVIFAKSIQHLTEKEYNDKMQNWISGLVKNRYHPN